MLSGMLAHVQSRHLEAEGLHRSSHPGHRARSDQPSSSRGEGLRHHGQLGEELTGVGVVNTGHVGSARLDACPRVDEAGVDVRALESVWLVAGSTMFSMPDIGQQLAIRFQR